MENASKALIIAGAILLSILIIALGIYVFNMAKGATNTDQLEELEISQFNDPFTDYEGRRLGTDVTALLDKVVTNINTNKDADDRLPDVVYLETRTSGGINKSVINGAEDVPTKSDAYDEAVKLVDTEGVQDKFCIPSDSGKLNNIAVGQLRSRIANRHYYEVTFHKSTTTGIIDYIFIKYYFLICQF